MRKTIALLLTVILVCSLAACSGKTITSEWQDQYDLGLRFLSEGNYEEAIIAFTVAIEIDPKQASAYVGRGDAYVMIGETLENLATAMADYEHAIKLNEAIPEAWLGLADVYIRQGEYEKAYELLKEALEKTGGNQSIADKLAEIESGQYIDSIGNIRRMNAVDLDGTLIWYHEFTYDDKHRMASVVAYDGAKKRTSQVILSYDQNNNPTTSYSYTDDGTVSRIDYEYNEKNQISKATLYHDGAASGYETYDYDSSGHEIRLNQFDIESGECYSYRISEYDSRGNLIKWTYYSNQGIKSPSSEFEYDKEGRMIKQSIFDDNGLLKQYIVTTYDEKGNRIQDSYDADGILRYSTNPDYYKDE